MKNNAVKAITLYHPEFNNKLKKEYFVYFTSKLSLLHF